VRPSDPFPRLLHAFFHEWMVQQRNASIHTVRSYRDTWRLFLRFVAPRCRRTVAQLTLADLTAKSLIVADFAGDDVVYRLLNTTRVYALEKLEKQGEARAVKLRHAEMCREWAWSDTDTRFYSPAARIDDIRGAGLVFLHYRGPAIGLPDHSLVCRAMDPLGVPG